MGDRNPPLARDLAAVPASYTWKYGESERDPRARSSREPETEEEELTRLRAERKQLEAALEDVVALALSGAEYRERAIMMHRRAVAALSAIGRGPPEP